MGWAFSEIHGWHERGRNIEVPIGHDERNIFYTLIYRRDGTATVFITLSQTRSQVQAMYDDAIFIVSGITETSTRPADIGLNPRSMIGVKPNGNIILMAVDSGISGNNPQLSSVENERNLRSAISVREGVRILTAMGAVHTLNLDGGSSTQMWYDGQIWTQPWLNSRFADVGSVLVIYDR